jgi:hypothetical protein
MNDELESHCRIVARRLRDGTVVPFLGAGANLCGRPAGADWQGGHYLPSGAELTSYLADSYAYPQGERRDLLRVSQYVQAMTGGNVLYSELRGLFNREYEPTELHELLAAMPQLVRGWRAQGHESRFQLIVTTNYDDALEHAFTGVNEEFDLVTYIAAGRDRGKFVHHRPNGQSEVIKRPNAYRALSLATRTVILKIHGAVDREDAARDSYVITEDNYIEYLAQNAISTLMPVSLMAAMEEAHFQFLGYSLSDWNLRVILHRIWGEAPFGEQFQSWAVQKEPSKLEELLWRKRGVEIMNADLADYVVALRRELEL